MPFCQSGVWKGLSDGTYTRGVMRVGLDPQQWPEAIYCSTSGYLYRFWLLSYGASLVQYHTGQASVSFNSTTKEFIGTFGDCNSGNYSGLPALIAAGRTTL